MHVSLTGWGRRSRRRFNLAMWSQMDNLTRTRQPVEAAITAAGASLLYLPAYNPDPNSIEQFFANLKHARRLLAPKRRYGRSPASSSACCCRLISNYLTHAGYEPT